MKIRLAISLFALGASIPVHTAAADDSRAMYLANEGVLVTRGDTKVLFDPLFDNAFDRYDLLPDDMSQALFAGEPPFDGVDAVMVSHYHGDHFAPAMMLDYLRAQPEVRLYAPMQAVSGMRQISGSDDEALYERVVGLVIDVGDEPLRFSTGELSIDAVRIPHAGWPNRMTDVENIVFRVTLDDSVTVVHLGDAEPDISFFRQHTGYWDERVTNLALPPYWFFLSDEGEDVLDTEIEPRHAIGIHVPTAIPDDPSTRQAEDKGYDLFKEPGETREILP